MMAALVLRAERVHHQPHLIAILEVGVHHVQVDISDLLYPSLFPLPTSPFQQFFDPLLELLVLLEQLLDPTHQVLGLRLQDPGRLVQLPSELAHQLVGHGPGHGFDAAHTRGGPSLVGEAEQRNVPGRRHVRAAA